MSFVIGMTSAPHLREFGDYLISRGYDIRYFDFNKLTPEETIENFRGCNGVISRNELFPESVLKTLSKDLKIIARFGLGFEKIDVPAATKQGICVTTAVGTMASGVAETAFLLMLECGRHFAKYDADMQKGVWDRNHKGTQLENKVVGIVGFGHIGQKLAQYCQGFNCKILAYDIVYNEKALKDLHVTPVSLDELAEQSDFISINCPLNPSTRGIIDKAFFDRMKSTAYIVNTSRGPTIDEAAMVEALESGRISGAGLDVFMQEPLEAESRLRGNKNVILLPHVASMTHESMTDCILDVEKSLATFLSGKVPEHALNPDYVQYLGK